MSVIETSAYAVNTSAPNPFLSENAPVLPENKRIGSEAFGNQTDEGQELSPSAKEILTVALALQLKELEAVYKETQGLQRFVRSELFGRVQDYEPMSVGLSQKGQEPIGINSMIEELQGSVFRIHNIYENMRGFVTNINSTLREMLSDFETDLINFILIFKDYGSDGLLDNSNRTDYFHNLMDLNVALGKIVVNLEKMRGKVG